MTIEQGHVLNIRVFDDVFDTCVLSNAAHAHTMSVVAPEVLNKDVGCVGLGGKAVVTDIDAGVGHSEAIHVQRVEAVRVLGQGLYPRRGLVKAQYPGY